MRRLLGWGLGSLAAALGIAWGTTAARGQAKGAPSERPIKSSFMPTKWTRPSAPAATKPVVAHPDLERLVAPDPSELSQAAAPRASAPTGSQFATMKQPAAPPVPAVPESGPPLLPPPPHEASAETWQPSAVAPPSHPERPQPHVPPQPVYQAEHVQPQSAKIAPSQVQLPEAPEPTPPSAGKLIPVQPHDPPAREPLRPQPSRAVVLPATAAPTGEPYVTDAIVFVPETPAVRPASHGAPAVHSAPSVQTAPATPIRKTSAATARSSTTFLQTQLQRLIENACGTGVRNVQVHFPAANHVVIRFATRTEDEAVRYVTRIREMPELASFTIDDIEVVLVPPQAPRPSR